MFRQKWKNAKVLSELWMGKHDRGRVSVGSISRVAISLVVSLAITAIVAAFLLPVGLDEIVAVDTSNWSSGAQSIWNLLDVIILIALALFLFGIALAATEMVE